MEHCRVCEAWGLKGLEVEREIKVERNHLKAV